MLSGLFGVTWDGEVAGGETDAAFMAMPTAVFPLTFICPTLGRLISRQFHPLRHQLVPFQRRQFRSVQVLGDLP